MKNKYTFQVRDLRFQVDPITSKIVQLFEEYRAATANARLFLILIRRREIENISDGHNLIEVRIK